MKFDVHCISLARARDSRQRYIDAWKPVLGDRLKIFDAVDASTLPPGACFTRIAHPTIATRPSVACLMSHLTVMRGALEAGIGPEGVAIMEDDALPVPGVDVWEAVAQARREAPELSILVLTPPLMGGWTDRLTPSLGYPSRTFPAPAPGTHFVWYSAAGIRTYIDVFKSLPGMSDTFEFLPNDGRMARLWRPAAVHGDAPSTIGYIGWSPPTTAL